MIAKWYNTYNDGFRIPTELFTDKGIAYFSFNKRGVDVADEPPFHTVIQEEYRTYFPSNGVEDIYSIIITLRELKRLAKSKILLNGCSEGTVIAPLFASKYPDMADALFLCGYSNINMKDMQIWQCSKFENGDTMLKDCFNAVERKDNDWLMNNMGVTLEWLLDHYKLTGNKNVLPTLKLPIYIFHGALDNYCDLQGVYDIRNAFAELGKTNLTVNIFENHGHGLESDDSPKGVLSEAREALLNAIYDF